MKKILLAGIMLLTALMASAQIKVAPKMQKGDKKVYVTETTTTIAGQKSITMTVETQYAVTDVTPDGYVLNVTVTDVQTDADKNDLTGRIISLSQEMLKGINTSLSTDKDGKVMGILNYQEVKNNREQFIDKILEEVPATPALSKDVLKEQLLDQLSEESLLKSMQISSSPLTLNGKTITNGMQDEFLNLDGLRMKRTYAVTQDNTIETTSAINLSNEEMKQFVIAQVEKLMPGQADMVRQNIDTIISTGMLKLKIDEKDVYTLQADGWVSGITSNTICDTMGQKTTVSSVVRLKQ